MDDKIDTIKISIFDPFFGPPLLDPLNGGVGGEGGVGQKKSQGIRPKFCQKCVLPGGSLTPPFFRGFWGGPKKGQKMTFFIINL